ncbi:MAG: hypothetical protein GY861_22760, partial [bacterium]|nr:hypothetical protein [bacterium]
CSFMSFAPKYDPSDQYVPESKYAQVWEDSQQTLSDYLEAHFKNRPYTLDNGLLIDNCTASIMMVAESMNKSRDENVIKKMLRVINQRLQRTHQEMADHSEQEDKEFEEEEETPEQKKTREGIENSWAIVTAQQTNRLLDFQTDKGVPLFSSVLKKPGTPSPVHHIIEQPIVTETAQDQPRAASVSIPIKELISNDVGEQVRDVLVGADR